MLLLAFMLVELIVSVTHLSTTYADAEPINNFWAREG